MSLIDPPAPKNEGETLRVGTHTNHFPSRHVLDFVKSSGKRVVVIGGRRMGKTVAVEMARKEWGLSPAPNCIGHCDPKLTDPYNESDTLP